MVKKYNAFFVLVIIVYIYLLIVKIIKYRTFFFGPVGGHFLKIIFQSKNIIIHTYNIIISHGIKLINTWGVPVPGINSWVPN